MQDLEIQDFGSDSGSDLTDDSANDEVDEEDIAEYLDTLHLPGLFKSSVVITLYKFT